MNSLVNIDTSIQLKWNDGKRDRKETIILPYQLHLLPHDNFDDEDKVVRICIGTLDTKEDISTQLSTLSSVLVRHKDCNMGMFQSIILKSGIVTLELDTPVVTEKKNELGRFFDIEGEKYKCNLQNTVS